jgi:hypothetical protein
VTSVAEIVMSRSPRVMSVVQKVVTVAKRVNTVTSEGDIQS